MSSLVFPLLRLPKGLLSSKVLAVAACLVEENGSWIWPLPELEIRVGFISSVCLLFATRI